jgi:outer membrane receptor protein involved in Fe transport
LSGKVYYYDSERGLPGAVNLYNKNYSERLWSRNVFAQFNGLFPLSSSVDMRVVMKYDYNRSLYKEVNADYASGEQVDKNVQNESYLSLAVGGNAWRGLSYSVAADVSYATLENNFVDSKAPRRFSSYTLFSAKYEWKKIVLSASLLALYMNDKVENGVSPEFYKRFSPSFSVVLRSLCGYEPLSLRFSYKDAYRVPTFADLYYLRLGNVGLKPERASQFNVGVVWGVRSSEALEKLDFTVDAYYNKVRDKIVALPTMYIWRMMNFGKADICGIDLNASVGVALLPGFKLLADVNYSWQHAVDVTDKSAKNYRDQLPYTPRHSGNFSLTFENPLVNASYMLSAVGKRYMLPQNTAKNRMVGYVEHSFSLNREFAFDDMTLRLQGELLNVGDEQYEVIRYYPMPGFSWRLSASLAF